MRRIASFLALALSATVLSAVAQAQDKPVDRSRWYDGTTQTSDDLRRFTVPKGFAEPAGAIVIRNARLFDGTGAAARPAAILIVGSHIARIAGTEAELAAPKDAQIIDAGNKTVMPGLIDLHTHLTYMQRQGVPEVFGEDSQADAALRGAERLRYFVESGITSVRDVGSHGVAPFILKNKVYTGEIPGPRIFAAGQLIVGIGGHGTETFSMHTSPTWPDAELIEATGPDAWRAAVRLQFKRGADLIKLASHFSPDEVKAAIEEAHLLGLRVTADSETIYTQMAVEAGIDCIEHPLPRSDETIRLMAKKGTYSDITLVPYQYVNAMGGYIFSTSRRFTESDAANFAMAKKLKAAGVKLGIGTDLTFGLYRNLPGPYIQELHNFETLGYSPVEALVTATKTNSEILGMSDRLGTVETGKLADLIFVDGKPDQSVDDLRRIEMVIVNGRVIVRDGRLYIPRHREETLTMPASMH